MENSVRDSFKLHFNSEVQRLHSVNPKPSVEERIKEVDDLIEEYVRVVGERPDAQQLNRLSDYLLVDVLTDQYKHARGDDKPFHTGKQAKRRSARQAEYIEGVRLK